MKGMTFKGSRYTLKPRSSRAQTHLHSNLSELQEILRLQKIRDHITSSPRRFLRVGPQSCDRWAAATHPVTASSRVECRAKHVSETCNPQNHQNPKSYKSLPASRTHHETRNIQDFQSWTAHPQHRTWQQLEANEKQDCARHSRRIPHPPKCRRPWTSFRWF